MFNLKHTQKSSNLVYFLNYLAPLNYVCVPFLSLTTRLWWWRKNKKKVLYFPRFFTTTVSAWSARQYTLNARHLKKLFNTYRFYILRDNVVALTYLNWNRISRLRNAKQDRDLMYKLYSYFLKPILLQKLCSASKYLFCVNLPYLLWCWSWINKDQRLFRQIYYLLNLPRSTTTETVTY